GDVSVSRMFVNLLNFALGLVGVLPLSPLIFSSILGSASWIGLRTATLAASTASLALSFASLAISLAWPAAFLAPSSIFLAAVVAVLQPATNSPHTTNPTLAIHVRFIVHSSSKDQRATPCRPTA